MALTRGKNFLESEEAQEIRRALLQMTLDSSYNTGTSFSSKTADYPDNRIPFVDKHMNYLYMHPKVEASKYLANVKLMSRIR